MTALYIVRQAIDGLSVAQGTPRFAVLTEYELRTILTALEALESHIGTKAPDGSDTSQRERGSHGTSPP
jgi:hypothetical protein